ncbi:MAG: carboxypeptidase-like regulatory domain-containing protein [candidate division WOR-3 bacterium]
MKKLFAILFGIAIATTIFAQTTGAISGIVTDSVSGAPIFNAMVTAYMPANNMCGGRAITDSNGYYIIENLAEGNYIVVGHARNYRSFRYPESVAVVAGQTTTNINFALAPRSSNPPPNPGTISGVVTDANTNEPIAGAIVIARTRRFVQRAVTGADGSYTITNLRAGTYRVAAHKQGYQAQVYPDPVILEVGGAVSGINFALVPCTTPPPPPQGTGAISGMVINAVTQQPIANAVVHACLTGGNCGGMARTGVDGTYTIMNLIPGSYQVTASAMGYMPMNYSNPVVVVENQTTSGIDFALQPRQP